MPGKGSDLLRMVVKKEIEKTVILIFLYWNIQLV